MKFFLLVALCILFKGPGANGQSAGPGMNQGNQHPNNGNQMGFNPFGLLGSVVQNSIGNFAELGQGLADIQSPLGIISGAGNVMARSARRAQNVATAMFNGPPPQKYLEALQLYEQHHQQSPEEYPLTPEALNVLWSNYGNPNQPRPEVNGAGIPTGMSPIGQAFFGARNALHQHAGQVMGDVFQHASNGINAIRDTRQAIHQAVGSALNGGVPQAYLDALNYYAQHPELYPQPLPKEQLDNVWSVYGTKGQPRPELNGAGAQNGVGPIGHAMLNARSNLRNGAGQLVNGLFGHVTNGLQMLGDTRRAVHNAVGVVQHHAGRRAQQHLANIQSLHQQMYGQNGQHPHAPQNNMVKLN